MKIYSFAAPMIAGALIFAAGCLPPPTPDPSPWYVDGDGDGYGDPNIAPVSAVEAPVGHVSNDFDCDDTNSGINPAAIEVYDGIDNNCNNLVDEGFTPVNWYFDNDSDGYGNAANTVVDVTAPAGYVASSTDCDDNNAAINPAATEQYDGVDNNCNGQVDEGFNPTTWYFDNDGDGFGDSGITTVDISAPANYVATGDDCNDNNSAINPGATEIYDQIDNDCDGLIDEGFNPVNFYQDADSDGYGNPGITLVDVSAPAGYVADNTDCNDNDAFINPGEAEIWDNIDNNCNGQIDEGFSPVTYYRDADSDGYGDINNTTVNITQPAGYVSDSTDCNDNNSAINPGVTEIYNGIDDNCDGNVDENFVEWFRDADNDSYGNAANSSFAVSKPAGYVADSSDCDDSDNSTYPGAVELPDGKDNNCDGNIDEGISTWYRDSDSDNYGNPGNATQAASQPNGYVADNTDCNDNNAAINPAATEVFDGVDNNCNGQIDEGYVTWYQDSDSDGYGNPSVSQVAAVQPGGYVLDASDCDDTNAAINPGTAEAYNGYDDNCNGQIDEGFNPVNWYQDADSDGYGNANVSVLDVSQPAGYVSNSSDCNDNNAAINPGATESYNSIDDNCNGQVDEGFVQYFQDSDSDGYGNASVSTWATSQPAGYVSNNTDCNDSNAAANPGASEVYDGIDNDCDGNIDEGFSQYWQDADSDGYGNASVSTWATSQPAGYVTNSNDCNDATAAANPGQTEIYDGIDNDCDGQVDEGAATYYRDADSDGYGNASNTTVDIGQPAGYVTNSSDCNDNNSAVNPGATEIYNSIDDNCDGNIDEGFNAYYRDQDGDSYGDASSVTHATSLPAGYSVDSADCNDSDASINPAATEIYDGVDNNCDGNIDEGAATYYRDIDGDNYGDNGNTTVAIGQPGGYVSVGGDCNDNDNSINPGATEAYNGVDDNCNGQIDEGFNPTTWYADNDNDGYGDVNNTTLDIVQPAGYVANSSDCDDTDASVHPGATEIANGIDDNCDGQIDEGLTSYNNHDVQKAWTQWYEEILCERANCVNPSGTGNYPITCDSGNVSWNISTSESKQTFNNCTYTIQAGTYGSPNPSDPLYGITLTVNGSITGSPDGTQGTIYPAGTVTITGDYEATVYDIRDVKNKVPTVNNDSHPFYVDVTCAESGCSANATRFQAIQIITTPYSNTKGPIYDSGTPQ